MMTVITGGSGSGKSAYAEDYICEIAAKSDYCNKYYIATMKVYDAEGQKKIDRHRRLRQGKGFITIEQPTDIENTLKTIKNSQNTNSNNSDFNLQAGGTIIDNLNVTDVHTAALLECMSNLVANEMFADDGNGDSKIVPADDVCEKIIEGIRTINDALDDLVIVTNNVFEDGIEYDDTTMEYIRAMGIVNQRIAAMADHVIEVVVGIPVVIR